MADSKRSRSTGIRRLHSKGCPGKGGGRCRCGAGYEAAAFSRRDGKKIRKTFAREAEARSWRADAIRALDQGSLRAPKPTTVREAWERWLEGARAGTVTTRDGDPYKPASIRSYERSMRLRVLPRFGPTRLSDLDRLALQDWVDDLCADSEPSTVKAAVAAIRPMLRWAARRGEIAVDPSLGLETPAARGRRERVAPPAEAEALIGALAPEERALWATALYAGLRRGELMALREADIDLGAAVIRIRKGWDQVEGEIALKTKAARRTVPIAGPLPEILVAHRIRRGAEPAHLAFGRAADVPFDPKAVQRPADAAWRRAKLRRITLHECRHTFASLMIAAGVNPKALQVFMGHTSISTTHDIYGHLFPGAVDEAASLLDDFLAADAGGTGESTGEQEAAP